jgi:hypothetical protein
MYFTRCVVFIVSICIGQIAFASPAQDKTVEEFFRISNLKKVTLDSLNDEDMQLFGKTKEGFWKQFEPEVKKIYKQVLTEEELRSSIQFYQSPEGRSLLNKTPELIKLSSQATMKILFDQDVLGLYQNQDKPMK